MSRSSHLRKQAGAVWLVLIVALALATNARAAGTLHDSTWTDAVSTAGDGGPLTDELGLLAKLQNRFASIAGQVSPSVVAISAPSAVVDGDGSARTDEMSTDRLRSMVDRSWRMVGSGFVIDSEGYIVTSEHVIKNAQQIWITTDDQKVYPAMVVGSDPRLDLAVIKAPVKNLPVVRLAKYGSVQRGQWTIAVGNPHGLAAEGQMSMSIGVVSALGRSLPDLARKEDRLYADLIQTSAQINPGNSGGPLLNLDGEVIGVNTATIFANGNTNGVGFAIPITARLMARIEDMKHGREMAAGYLGLTMGIPTPQQRAAAKLNEPIGACVQYVEPSSPAAASDLKVGDIIVAMDGEVVRSSDQMSVMICCWPVNKPTKLTIRRGPSTSVKEVALRRRQLPNEGIWRETQRLRWRGLLLGQTPTGSAKGKAQAAGSGVLVLAVEKESPLLKQGVKSGSVITALGDRPVHDLQEMLEIINDTPVERCELRMTTPAATAQCDSGVTAQQ
ncbi:MAG TPA: trypsin-like peptidase domain-containing protein [Tepidisphaeraceae bacterium]|nr:trypsin-like peptidase domain-containing protein [Tepidisphaeraceae bacterium]